MSSSEDYLDNLLASALQKNENPSSDGNDMSSLNLGTEDNPNRMMSEDEIATLIQNMNTEPEIKSNMQTSDLSRFGKREEIDESVSEALSNRKDEEISYSSVDVDESVSEALLNKKDDTIVYSSINVEESVSEALAKPKETDHGFDGEGLADSVKGKTHNKRNRKTQEKAESKNLKDEHSQEEIENRADELVSLLQDDKFYGETYDENNEDIEEDIEARLKAAEQQGMNDAALAGLMGLSLSEEAMDFTDFVDAKGIQSGEISQVSELIKKSDEGKLVDEASLPKQDSSETINLAGISLVDVMDSEQGEESDTFEEKEKKKRRKDKKSDKMQKNASDTEDSQENEVDKSGTKKAKKKGKNPNKKKKGLFWFLSKDNRETEEETSELSSAAGEFEVKQTAPHEGMSNVGNPINAALPNEMLNAGNAALPEEIADESAALLPEGMPKDGNPMNDALSEGIAAENRISDLGNFDNANGDPEIIVPLDNIQFGEEFSDADKNGEKGKKKKENIFTKLFHLLTEEVEEDEAYVPEQDTTKLSQENLEILSALDAAEDNKQGKKKKEKKKKEKKVKEKKAKPKPKKKEKPVSATKEDTKQIPRKHVMKTAVMAISLLVILLLLCLFLPEKLVVGEARDSYYQENYKDVFLSLYGKNLNESDQLIYDRSKLIVLLDRKYESYVNYKALGMKLEALNSLLEGLKRYDDIIERGEKLNIKEKLDEIRSKITAALLSDYALTENEALEILQYSDLDYSNRVNSIVDGSAFIKAEDAIRSSYGLTDQNEINVEETVPMQLPDLLPEELEYQQSLMQDDADLQNENSYIQNENTDTQDRIGTNENIGPADANENGSIDSSYVGGAINQNGQSLQLQIESEQF